MHPKSVAEKASRARRRSSIKRLHFEWLEQRRLLAGFVVNALSDLSDSGSVPGVCDTELNPDSGTPASGLCTLRAAIESSNETPEADTITFDLALGAEILTAGHLEALGSVRLLGPEGGVRITNANPANGQGGILLAGGQSELRNLVINGFNEAIRLISDSNIVAGSRIGVNAAGTAKVGNQVGIFIEGGHNLVGGTHPADRNVISGNQSGIVIANRQTEMELLASNRVEGNFIGTDITGEQAIGNTLVGVRLGRGATETLIGGPTGAENLVSGNGYGILIETGASTNYVVGNLVGTNVAGEVALGNHDAIVIVDSPDNVVGGRVPSSTEFAGNVISGSTGNPSFGTVGSGIYISGSGATGNVVQGNQIGTNLSGDSAIPNAGDGVSISRGSHNILGGALPEQRNTISGNLGDGVFITGSAGAAATGNLIIGNFIGTNGSGTAALENGFRGIHIDQHTSLNTVGGAQGGERNLISGNRRDGVIIALASAVDNRIIGNYIGTDVMGEGPIPNQASGVFLLNSRSSQIGGSQLGEGNTIAGNDLHGIRIEGPQASQNRIEGNFVGTLPDGTLAMPQHGLGNKGDGIYILGATENSIGQDAMALEVCDMARSVGNTIGGNRGAGIRIEGPQAQRNSLRCNSIVQNEEIGIDLVGDGVTPNDTQDGDTGPNQLQNFPIISILEKVEDSLRISGTLNGKPQSEVVIDFYATDTSSARRLEDGIQGERYLGSFKVATDANGDVRFETPAQLLLQLGDKEVVTATATDDQGNTSEFSNFTPDFIANGVEIRTPVVFVPGFFGSFVPEITNDAQAYGRFLLTLGIAPTELTLDPILKGYDDLVASLITSGYELDRDLFLAPYDWRLALAPSGPADTRDGRIEVAASQIVDGTFEYGIDYLGYWLKVAAERWYAIHQQPLTNVHIVAHSMGGLLSRTYIQSSAYGGSFSSSVRNDGGELVLPVVNSLTMLGVPNRGAAVTFPTWGDNFNGDLAYQLVLSKFVSQAWKLLQTGNIAGIDRSSYDLNAIGLDLQFQKTKFVREYVRGMGDLLPEYPDYAVNFTPSEDFENQLLLDLNQSVRSSLKVPRTTLMYGMSLNTHTHVRKFTGPLPSGSPSVLSFTDSTSRVAEDGYDWYWDVDLPANGDGTVPLQSLEELFSFDESVERFSFCARDACPTGNNIPSDDGVAHTEIVANRDVQQRILRLLGHPLLFSQISTGRQTGQVFQIEQAAVPFNALNILLDPVDAWLVDAFGNRLGYSEATGPLREIPGSVWFGGQIGIGWILGTAPHGPLQLQMLGLGDAYAVEVSNALGGAIQRATLEGFLGLGDSLSHVVPLADAGAFVYGDTLYYFAAPGIANDVSLNSDQENAWLMEATGLPISTGAQCAAVVTPVVSANCALETVSSVRMTLGDQNDQVQMHGLLLPLRVEGGAGNDQWLISTAPSQTTFDGGAGQDALIVVGEQIHLDLANPNLPLPLNIESIDITGTGSNQLSLHPDAIRMITDSADVLLVRHDSDDLIRYLGNWQIDLPAFVDGEMLHVAHAQNAQLQLANLLPWQNPLRVLDVNRDDFISPIDVLLIINSINTTGARPLSEPQTSDELQLGYIDTSGDKLLSALDALLVINFLNSQVSNLDNSEGEAVRNDSPAECNSNCGTLVEQLHTAGMLDDISRLTATGSRVLPVTQLGVSEPWQPDHTSPIGHTKPKKSPVNKAVRSGDLNWLPPAHPASASPPKEARSARLHTVRDRVFEQLATELFTLDGGQAEADRA